MDTKKTLLKWRSTNLGVGELNQHF